MKRAGGNGAGDRKPQRSGPVRWAVVGLGHFAQSAILPAFAHARRDARLVALFSDDEKKRKTLGKRHKAPLVASYEQYDEILQTGQVDVVYLALPNHLHREYTVRAARAGVHVLCEKPMAVTVEDCEEMIRACDENQVKLMIAYRLHFEKANLSAIAELRAGRIGEPRYLVSAFSFILDEGNVRGMPSARGGGPVHDIGAYCINASRFLFADEPEEVVSMAGRRSDAPALEHIEEQVSAIMRFPGDRLASFTVSFGSADVGRLTVMGTKGSLTLDPAYTHRGALAMTVETPRGKRQRRFPKTDQVAAELIYFSDCVRKDKEPEPSGREGLHDVAIINAVLESSRTGRSVHLDLRDKKDRPKPSQKIAKPPVKEPKGLVKVAAPREA